MILPLQNFKGNSPGEDDVWKIFKESLPDDIVSFHNYDIPVKQADVTLLVPTQGILIIEIKSFLAKNILDVPDNSIIRLKKGPPEPSPFTQARGYCYHLKNELLTPNGLNSVYISYAVCYPYITHEEYVNLGLNKISREQFTFTKEDLVSKAVLLEKIQNIFDVTYNIISEPNLVKYGFSPDILNHVGNLISPNFRNETHAATQPAPIDTLVPHHIPREFYSKLIFVSKSNPITTTELQEIASLWCAGTKIYFYSDDATLLEQLTNYIQVYVTEKNLTNKSGFSFSNGQTFQFNSGLVSGISTSFSIINGENLEHFKSELDALHSLSSFNKDQYYIEHAPLSDIIVKAGAGTGKTFSIVSRVNYLIWKNSYQPEDLKRAIAMITFTNESADAMRKKLSQNFLNYYLLTQNNRYLDYIEYVTDMNISTIHSISKKLLSKYASHLGLGKDFRIIIGEYQRNLFLQQNLNRYIATHPNLDLDTDLSMFQLTKRLLNFLGKMDNKNVDLLSYFSSLNFGVPTNAVFADFIQIAKETQADMAQYCLENNVVCLGDLIKKVRTLQSSLNSDSNFQPEPLDFLFVDEFQDTDDTQIELMKDLRKLFHFNFFVVGDIKQCIYRFRGAEVKAFDTLQLNEKPMISISLNKNYRTDTLLLQKLNTIFTEWNTASNLEYRTDDVLVGVKKLSTKAEFYKQSYMNTPDFNQKLIRTIQSCKNRLTSSTSKIAILVRYNWQISQIKELCNSNGIPIDTAIGGELFRIDPTIDFFKLILALKFNDSPEHLYNLYSTSYVSEHLPKAELFYKSEHEIKNAFYSCPPQRLLKWSTYLERLRVEPILKVLRDIIDDVKPWEVFAQKATSGVPDVERAESYYLQNLDQLFEKLIATSNTDYLTLNKICDYLEIMILTKQEEDARASYNLDQSSVNVICTTVHKSKGLEFETVILPFCDFNIADPKPKGDVDLIYVGNDIGYRILGNNRKIEFENDLYQIFKDDEIIDRMHEETRILYVALTRAIKRIIVFSNPALAEKDIQCWDRMIKE